MELAKGHGASNAITVVMESRGLSLQASIGYIFEYCCTLIARLRDAQHEMSKRTDNRIFSIDATRCLQAFGDWVRGNEEYVFHPLCWYPVTATFVRMGRWYGSFRIFCEFGRWSFVTERYFGQQNKSIRQTRIVTVEADVPSTLR